jgi:hypothetical protein
MGAGIGSIVGGAGGLGTTAFHGRQKNHLEQRAGNADSHHRLKRQQKPALVDNAFRHQVTTARLALLLMHEQSTLSSVPISDDP